MNRTIRVLMFSDIFMSTGFGLYEPFLAIFIKENLAGGTILTAGIASSLFLITKSLIQLPFSRYVDSHDDKVRWLLLGMGIVTVVPFLYMFADSIVVVYIAQVLYGVGAGLAYPTWLGLWSTHLDEHHESFEWSLYSTTVGIGTAAAASVGAGIAEFVGYQATFLVVGVMSVAACLSLLLLEKKERVTRSKTMHYHKRQKLTHKR